MDRHTTTSRPATARLRGARPVLVWLLLAALLAPIAATPAAASDTTRPATATATTTGGTIAGRVTDAVTGEPVEGIAARTVPGAATITTDADGSYSLAGLDAGQYLSEFTPTHTYRDEWYSDSFHHTGATYVDVVDGETTTADAQLNSGAVIAGTVTDADTGEPLASGLPNLVGVDLVIIASSVKPRAVGSSLADVEVPLLTWEAYLFDDLGLSTRRRETTVDYRSMDLASGESVTVYAQQHRLAWGSPGADAAVHATVPGQPNQATWFTYLPGDALANGRPAPSCRTALFSDYRGTLDLTAHGEAIFVDAVGAAVACGAASTVTNSEPGPVSTVPPPR